MQENGPKEIIHECEIKPSKWALMSTIFFLMHMTRSTIRERERACLLEALLRDNNKKEPIITHLSASFF